MRQTNSMKGGLPQGVPKEGRSQETLEVLAEDSGSPQDLPIPNEHPAPHSKCPFLHVFHEKAQEYERYDL